MLVPADRLNNNARITFIAQTDVIENTAFAKLAFTREKAFPKKTIASISTMSSLHLWHFKTLSKTAG